MAPGSSADSSKTQRFFHPSRGERSKSATSTPTPSTTARPTSCGKACYECLLDYGNQPDHKDLDRTLIRDFLSDLARAECRPAGGPGSRAERVATLRKRCDSQLEERWLDHVDTLGLRLPSDAQYRIPGYPTQPDFFYREASVAIYVDGPPHDTPDKIREDEAITKALDGDGVYRDSGSTTTPTGWPVFRRHPDIFGAARQANRYPTATHRTPSTCASILPGGPNRN